MINKIEAVSMNYDMIYREISARKAYDEPRKYVADLLAETEDEELWEVPSSIPVRLLSAIRFYLFGNTAPKRMQSYGDTAAADRIAIEVVIQFLAEMTRKHQWCSFVHDVMDIFICCMTSGGTDVKSCGCVEDPCIIAPDGKPCHYGTDGDVHEHERDCAWWEPQ